MKATTQELAVHALYMRINFIETGLTHISAEDAKHMNRNLARNDPRRQPIKSLTGHQLCVIQELHEAIAELQAMKTVKT